MQNDEQKRPAGQEKNSAEKPDKAQREAAERKKPASEAAVTAAPGTPGDAGPARTDEGKAAPVSRKADAEKPASASPSRKAEGARIPAGAEERPAGAPGQNPSEGRTVNRLREFRIERMMSKAELARKAGLSVLTVARIESGYGCRMDTKRKLLKALGLRLSDRRRVFEDD